MSRTLQHSPADIVAQHLVDAGLGTDPLANKDWSIFATSEPNLPDNVITVRDTAGMSDGRTMDGQLQDHFGIQIRVRAQTHNLGHRKLNSIRVYISEQVLQRNVTLDGIKYLIACYSHIGQIIYLGKNVPNSKHSLFTLNCTVPVDQITGNTVS